MANDLRRAVIRTHKQEQEIIREPDGTPKVFPNPSTCTRFLTMLRDHQKHFKGTEAVVYRMTHLDAPEYKRLLKRKEAVYA